MEPISQSFDESKNKIIDVFPAALQELDMVLYGSSERLGLISIKQPNQSILLYAHIVEHSDESTSVTIAPGEPYLKDRDNTERPDSTIQQIQHKLETVLSKNA